MYLQRGKKSTAAQSQSTTSSAQKRSQNTKSSVDVRSHNLAMSAEVRSKNATSAFDGTDKCDIFTHFNITHSGNTFPHHLCTLRLIDMMFDQQQSTDNHKHALSCSYYKEALL